MFSNKLSLDLNSDFNAQRIEQEIAERQNQLAQFEAYTALHTQLEIYHSKDATARDWVLTKLPDCKLQLTLFEAYVTF